MMGNAKGYPLRTPLSAAIPLEKRTVLRFFGADVQELDDSLCPAPGAPEGAIATARETAANEPGFVLLDQYANEANPDAHFRTTGPEIWRQTEGKITHFVASLGTCGTITGTGRFLKGRNPAVKVLGVYPEDGHDIPGVRSRRQLDQTKLYFPKEYDGEVEITQPRGLRPVPAAQPGGKHHRGARVRAWRSPAPSGWCPTSPAWSRSSSSRTISSSTPRRSAAIFRELCPAPAGAEAAAAAAPSRSTS